MTRPRISWTRMRASYTLANGSRLSALGSGRRTAFGSGLRLSAPSAAPRLPPGRPPEFTVDERQQAVEGAFAALSPFEQEARDIGGRIALVHGPSLQADAADQGRVARVGSQPRVVLHREIRHVVRNVQRRPPRARKTPRPACRATRRRRQPTLGPHSARAPRAGRNPGAPSPRRAGPSPRRSLRAPSWQVRRCW